ncbi:MAG: endonuclease VIII [Clostridiales bacterium]|nr:endonuclease VIII [Clostridiales bacterium]
MIEIPESTCLSKQLNEILNEKTVVEAISMKNPHRFAFTHGDPTAYPELLIGKRFRVAEGHGSWIVMDFGDVELMVSEGTRLFYSSEFTELPSKHQLLIKFDDNSYLSASIQLYGGLICAVKEDYDEEYYRNSLEKPFVLDDAFDENYFRSLLTEGNRKKSAKAFLATEQRFPGLGNGVLQDILFNAGIHPKTIMGNLAEKQIEGVFRAIKATISEMIALGGRDTERNLFGAKGGYVTKMSKHTVGEPCPVCGNPIEKAHYMGGSVYFCRTCQPLSK